MSRTDAAAPDLAKRAPADAPLRRLVARLGRRRLWRVLALQLLCVGIPVVFWEAAIRSGMAQVFFFGEPSQVVEYVVKSLLNGSLLFNSAVTLSEQVIGLALGTAVGTAIALGLWWSSFLSRVLESYGVILNATPKIVVAPLLVFWFGFGMTSKVMISALITAIVAWLGAFEGVRRCDPDQADLVRALGGSERLVFLKIVVPSTLPYLFATLRLNIGFSLLGVITGEYLSSTAGLGYLIDTTAKTYQMSDTLGAILTIAVIAAFELWLLVRVELRLIGWSEGVTATAGG